MSVGEGARPLRVVIVGKGRLGWGLCRALRARGVEARLVASRALRGRPRASLRLRADEGVVILAVSDPHIASLATALSPSLAGRVVLHCAGALGPEALDAAARAGAHTGVMHPLVSFADGRRAPPLRDTTFVIDGALRARRCAKTLARALGAHPLEASIHGASYHAAAALAANGSAALAARAASVMRQLGLSQVAAERALGALLVSVGQNIMRIGLPAALTGPVVRGDAKTVAQHRAALEGEALAAYDAIAPLILALAQEGGLSASDARSLRRAMAARP